MMPLDFSDPMTWILAVIVIIVLIVCAAASPKGDSYNASKDPKNMEIRTNADGSCSVYNYKTEETIATFPERSAAVAFLDDLKG